MKIKGKNLKFISRILRDGSGTAMIKDEKDVDHVQEEEFRINCLSITNGTFIASGFNSYVVKIKIKL